VLGRRGFLSAAIAGLAGSTLGSGQLSGQRRPIEMTVGDERRNHVGADAPLIVTSNDPSVGNRPEDISRNVAAGVAAAEAGAAILHHHVIWTPRKTSGVWGLGVIRFRRGFT